MEKRHQLEKYIVAMKGLSPLDKLNQGYSYVADRDGNKVSSVEKLETGDELYIYMKDGKVISKVETIEVTI